jgi:hypothetical protein
LHIFGFRRAPFEGVIARESVYFTALLAEKYLDPEYPEANKAPLEKGRLQTL